MTHFLEHNALRLESAGKDCEKHIINAVSSCGITATCYAYKFRVKSEAKLVEKVHRKVKEKPLYDLASITDVLGLRLITLFRHEIPTVLKQVLLLIKHEQAVEPNPFEQNRLDEVIVYTNAFEHDPFLIELKSTLSSENVTATYRQSPEGYSSVHIVSRSTHKAKLKTTGTNETNHQLPVEIQIRSVFEDAWGEIDHRFGYSVRTGKSGISALHNSALVQPHLKVLKQFTDACAVYADTIYASAHAPVSLTDTAGKIESVPSDDEVLNRFTALGVPTAFRDQYIQGRKLREQALSSIETDRAKGKEQCLEAAAYFLSLQHDASNKLTPETGFHLYQFYAKMNEALCLLSTDSPQHVISAETIYVKLRENYPNFLLVWFRLAQACAKLGKTSEAITLFKDTAEQAKLVANKYANQQIWPDELPRTDHEHIAPLLPKLLGYQYWKQSQQSTDNSAQLESLALAINATIESFHYQGADYKIDNNIVYYATEYLTKLNGAPNNEAHRIASLLRNSLVKLEAFLEQAPQQQDISVLETMMFAYNFLRRTEQAYKLSTRILDIVKDSKDAGDPNEVLEITRSALAIQALQAPSPGDGTTLDS